MQICSPPLGAISIHAPRTGSDETWRYAHTRRKYFNPRSPHGERREQVRLIHAPFYFNPRSPHGERHNQRRAARGRKYISIHAPRTGSDKQVEVDVAKNIKFQSTLPARGATHYHWQAALSQYHFNPRSPHGERPACGGVDIGLREISIHAPRTGSDAIEAADDLVEWAFQSTLPARGATLLEGNPGKQKLFQSTLPARGATAAGRYRQTVRRHISIHAPRTGSDTLDTPAMEAYSDFNPRSPHGERRDVRGSR